MIYKRRRVLTEQLAEKRGVKFTRKVLDYLFGQSYRRQLHQHREFINEY
jgi:hypothetical protein